MIGDRAVGGQPQPQEAGRVAAGARWCRGGVDAVVVGRRRAVRRGAGDGCDVRGERVGQGARRVSRYWFAVRRRRFRAGSRCAERHAGRAVGAVVGAAWRRSPRNTALLLAQLADVPDERRGAAFVSACALVYRAGDARKETVVRGRWPGSIVREPRGAGGFGYDPVFLPQGWWRTAAELSPEQKDSVSHRGRALSALLPGAAGACLRSPVRAPVKCPCRRNRQGQRRRDQARQ